MCSYIEAPSGASMYFSMEWRDLEFCNSQVDTVVKYTEDIDLKPRPLVTKWSAPQK